MTVTLELDLEEYCRTGMYDELCEMFCEEEVKKALEQECVSHITQMFDNRERLKQMEENDGNI